MKIRIVITILCIIVLGLAACKSATPSSETKPSNVPGSGSVDGSPTVYPPPADSGSVDSSSTAYPPPSADQGISQPDQGAYPAPDQPVSSDQPLPGAGNERSPLDPIPGEEKMIRGEVFFDKQEVSLMESNPVQVVLHLVGSLPTPCHYLRGGVTPPDSQGRIILDMYSLVEGVKVCTQVLQPFDVSINLGSFSPGKYSIWVNGGLVGEFTQ
jgi:hypothetical protein